MGPHVDLRIAELLASRLCHDLVSPIGAVNNGMELLEDDPDPEMMEEAVRLASNSARQASSTVQFYRVAYGRAGYELERDPQQLARLVEAYVASQKVSVDWQGDGLARTTAQGGGKLLLNMTALALEALPRGGAIEARAEPVERGLSLSAIAVGQGARLRPESRAALQDDVEIDSLTPRTVHGCFTRLLALHLGGRFAVEEEGEGRVSVTAWLPER